MKKHILRTLLVFGIFFVTRTYSQYQYTITINQSPGSPSVVCTNSTVILFASSNFTDTNVYYTWVGSTFSFPVQQQSITVGPGTYTVGASSGFASLGYQSVVVGACTGVDEYGFEIQSIEVFPNPVKDVVYFKSEKNFPDKISVSIYTVFGQLIYSDKDLDIEKGIDLKCLKPQLYYITLRTEESQKTFKLVKE